MDHARRFADRAAAVVKLSARTLMLDSEVAIYDQQLRSRFDWLRELDPNAVATPPLFTFDVLYLDRRDRTGQPLRDRRARLEDVGPGASWSSRCAASRQTVWRRGSRWSGAAARATSPRARPACTRAGRRGGGGR
jgi:ATP-dependent DNA ligase